MISRRRFTRGALASMASSALLVPTAGRAAASTASQRKFLFIYASGGWDPTWVFAPVGEGSIAVGDPSGQTATVGGLTYVSNETRGSVDTFFQSYGDRCCIINGLEIPSVTHERCRTLSFTGGSGTGLDDWPSILAGASTGFTLPHLVLSGPSFTSRYTASVMRLGESSQLSALISGSALSRSDTPLSMLSQDSAALVETFVAARRQAWIDAAGRGQARRHADALGLSAEQVELLQALQGDIELGVESKGWVYASDRVRPALTCMERGFTRCALVEQAGEWNVTWDNHTNISQMDAHYRTLFDDLLEIMADVDSRTTVSGGRLADELTIVVFSEMGRTPTLNSGQGKDHWTCTSAMLIGAGVRGDQVVGAFDDQLLGRPIDLSSGQASEHGTAITAQHLGATLLALGDIDPGQWVGDVAPIEAALA